MKTEIWLIRHGETDWNAKQRLQGWVDIPLNATGKKQALAVRHYIQTKQLQVDHVVSSDLSRAAETAQIAFDLAPTDLKLYDSLRERNYGIYEGELWQTLIEVDSQNQPTLNLRDPNLAIPQGESLIVFNERILTAFNQLADEYQGERLAVFAHGGVIDIVWRHLHQADLLTPRPEPILNASVNHFIIKPDLWQVMHWGQHDHLQSALDELPL